MSTLLMPELGSGVLTVTVRRWLKTQGQSVKSGDLLLEGETENGFVELEVAGIGTLGEILVPAGHTVAVGTPIAELVPGGSTKPTAVVQQASAPVPKGAG